MARGGFILGGLLQGAGAGLSMTAAQKRDDALERLRNSRQIEAEGRKEAADVRAEDRANTMKVGLLSLANEYKRQEAETDQQYQERLLQIKADIDAGLIVRRGEQDRVTEGMRARNDASLAKLRSSLDTQRDAASIRLKNEIDSGQVKSVETGADGAAVVVYNDGRTVRVNGANLQLRASGEDEGVGGAIAAARARQGGGATPAPSPSPSASPRASARPAPAAADPTQTPEGRRAIQATIRQLMASGELEPGEAVGETVTAPAGSVAAVAVTMRWDGKDWVFP